MILLFNTLEEGSTLMRRHLQQWCKSPFFPIALAVIVIWIKTVFAYYADFSLGVADLLQFFLTLFNPIGATLLLLSIALYIKNRRVAFWVLVIIDLLSTILLYANVLYYREFTDFLTVGTMLGVSKVSRGLSGSSIMLMKPHDIIYWLDFIGFGLFLIGRGLMHIRPLAQITPVKIVNFFNKPALQLKPISTLQAFAVTSLATALFSADLSLSEMNRPQLLTRTFDRNYIVKYIGIDALTVYDAIKTAQNNQVRSQADSAQLDDILNYVHQNYAAPNKKYFGIAKGKNVIIIHLESFQQFLIGQKIDGQEVTPFLNSLYHDKNTISFDNFFHQVGQGKTSDAENMLETSTFGLPQGSLFTTLGSDNTFQAAPAILQQQQGYTSAVFHGNVGTFWNRDNTYRSMGYDYFFDKSYFDASAGSSMEYGLKDKLMFAESIKYLEQLQQPFYAKFITVTNHFPYPLSKEDTNFPSAGTDDDTVNGYFQTAHYLDQAVQEFFNYLKASGLYDKSIIILYGDHYGISDSSNKALAPLLGKDPERWNDFDNAQLQRVPFMIHMPGLPGGIRHTYGGEIDVLPTLLHLLGINTQNYVQFGTDLLSPQHQQLVAFRNHDFVTPKYTYTNGKIYRNSDGAIISDPSPKLQKLIARDQAKVNTELSLSDKLNQKNLLRFYTPPGFKPVAPKDYDYNDCYQREMAINQRLGDHSTSLFAQNHDKSTTDLYHTDAPELNGKTQDITDVPDSVKNNQDSEQSQSTTSMSSSCSN